jgi:hypothetical protein
LEPIEKPKECVSDKRTVKFDVQQTSVSGGTEKRTEKMEYIKTPSHEKAITAGKRLSLDPGSSSGFGKRPTMLDEEKKANTKHTRKIEEPELDNGMRCLRGMSQLHRAAVADRFKFCADASVGQPLVLGNSTSVHANIGKWYSDVSYLQKFHNSAIRVAAPSGLSAVQEQKLSKTKKKKQHSKKDDVDDLTMSDSGLFAPMYPIDESLKCLRRIRKKAFPEAAPVKQGLSQTEILAMAATKLKSDLQSTGAFFPLLHKVRERGVTEEEQKELDEALAKSGFVIEP